MLCALLIFSASAALPAAKSKAVKPAAPQPVPTISTPTLSATATSPTAGLPRSISRGDRESPMIALTFDDAPHPEYVPRLLALFRAEEIKVTFFLVGEQLRRFPDVARAIVADGHEIGNHSLNHRNLQRASASTVEEEIAGMQKLIQDTLGVTPTLFRPPFGATPNEVRRVCAREHLSIILWDVDTNDWREGATRDTIVRNVLTQATSGSIVLLHATHLRSIEAAAEVIPVLRARKFQLVTVSQLLEDRARREEYRRLHPRKEPAAPAAERDNGASAPDERTSRPIVTPVLPTP